MMRYLLSLCGIVLKTNWMKRVFVLHHLKPEEKAFYYALRGTSKEDRDEMAGF